jgi:hypothetical protein
MSVCTQKRLWWHLKKYRNYSLCDEFHGRYATSILTEQQLVFWCSSARTCT